MITRLGTVAAMAFVAIAAAGAQQPVFRSAVDSVVVDVSVFDGRRPVANLTPADFEVLDNGVAQTIIDATYEVAPIDVTLLLDVSGSVEGQQLRTLVRAASDVGRRLRPADRAAAALHRPGRRPRGTPRRGDAGCACPCGRHRGPRAHAAVGRLQYGSHHPRCGGSRGVPGCPDRTRGCGKVPGRGPDSGPTAAPARASVGSVLAVGRARPSGWRWCRKPLSPATAARGFLPLSAPRRGWRRLGCRHSSRDKKAVLAVLRFAPALQASPSGACLIRSRLWIARRPCMGAASLNEEQTL